MSARNYDEALRRLLADEGGYTNHPRDPGGPTNFGITIYDYRKYVKPGATAADVKAMRIDEAKAIYRAKYWAAQRCDELPPGVDYAVFDYGVNSGIGRSGKVLRRLLGLSDATSAVTAEVIAAAAQRDPAALAAAICDERLAFLRRLPTWDAFGVGWGRRVAGVRATSIRMAKAQPLDQHAPAGSVGVGQVPAPKAATNVATGGGAVATAGAVAQASWLAAHPGLVLLIVVVGVSAVGGAIYLLNRWRSSRQEAATPGFEPVPIAAAGAAREA